MRSAGEIDWNNGEHLDLVSVGTHRLSLSVSGPDRIPGQPVIVIVHGLMSTMTGWSATRRELAKFARIIDYDRSGYGLSEEAPYPSTASNIATELGNLLKAANICPPYITIGHSWGGCLTMEFMAMSPQDIFGMVFVDAGVPHHFDVLPMSWKKPDMVAVIDGLDYIQVTGLGENMVLSPDEAQAMGMEMRSENFNRQVAKENDTFDDGFPVLAKKGLLERQPPILGASPICVLKGNTDQDNERMFRAGVTAGNGTEEQRAAYAEVLETWVEKDVALQKEFFKMSTNSHFIQASKKSGHQVQLTEPGLIADAVRWTLDI
jgi:pimeloyl-ACP methyl ester carboxylesterase